MYLEDGSPELKILKLLPSSPGLTPLSGTLSNPTSGGLRSESPPKSQASVSPHLALPETPQVPGPGLMQMGPSLHPDQVLASAG